ncbi:MAG: nitroreductase family protein [Arenimonas sp.]|jgi:nitroreductase
MMISKLSLISRISTPCKHLGTPGPDRHSLLLLLAEAVHVPDHGRLRPWRFILIEGDARTRIGEILFRRVQEAVPEASAIRLEKERTRFSFAPCIVAVVLNPVKGHKVPEIEQVLSAGAVCMNLLHAAHQAGFGAQWLTGFAAYDREVLTAVGLETDEQLIGYIHIGTRTESPGERERPDPAVLLTVAPP